MVNCYKRYTYTGTHILIYNTNQKKFVQIKFDDVLLFQKLTFEEEILLYAQRGNEIKKVSQFFSFLVF